MCGSSLQEPTEAGHTLDDYQAFADCKSVGGPQTEGRPSISCHHRSSTQGCRGTHTGTGRTCTLHTERLGSESDPQLSCCEATVHHRAAQHKGRFQPVFQQHNPLKAPTRRIEHQTSHPPFVVTIPRKRDLTDARVMERDFGSKTNGVVTVVSWLSHLCIPLGSGVSSSLPCLSP